LSLSHRILIGMGIRERRERERERRRQQIIVAAKRVFSANGFQKATMGEIAREAELSSGTLYIYFKKKEELYASLSLRILRYLLIRLEHIDSEASSIHQIQQLEEAMFDVYAFDSRIVLNIFHLHPKELLDNLSMQLVGEIEGLFNKAMQKIARVFEAGIEAGAISGLSSTTLAEIFWSLFTGAVLWQAGLSPSADRDEETFKRMLGGAFDVFRRGLVQAPAQ